MSGFTERDRTGGTWGDLFPEACHTDPQCQDRKAKHSAKHQSQSVMRKHRIEVTRERLVHELARG